MRVLIAGGEGQVGREFGELALPDMNLLRVGRGEFDITDAASVARALLHYRPDALVNAAAYTAVDRAEMEREQAFAINATGAANLARAAQSAGIPMIHLSTDYVFSGDKALGEAYTEQDACAPKTVYGQTKLEGEKQVLDLCQQSAVMRTSWVFGRFGGNFPKTMLRLAGERDQLGVVHDQWGCPTYAADIARAVLHMLRAMSGRRVPSGVYHYAGDSACTWFDLACYTLGRAKALGILDRLPAMKPIASTDYPVPAPRPANSVLDCSLLSGRVPEVELSDWKAGIETLLASGKT
ncbi:MAG TPA: dTDP-4-dehydrorhamnose reductase [Pseudomonadales bacterium]|nr:dTDP-4-dehydrorhamnose reductase [Pseudomonadales bacterium]